MKKPKTWVLTDEKRKIWIEKLEIRPKDLDLAHENWSIRKKSLRGGSCDGVDLIEIDNGALSFSVLPTRGMGIWKGNYKGIDLGWNSPIQGPVNPRFVNLQDHDGLGWIDGFDELVVRCGLNSNGPPIRDDLINQKGLQNEEKLTLHGKIANLPANQVEIMVIPGSPSELVVKGDVFEPALICPKYQLSVQVSTMAGSNNLLIEDEVFNMKSVDIELELLYHCNFGPPFLEAGSRLEVAAREVAPRDNQAALGIKNYETYDGPISGFTEQVYWYDLIANQEGKTLVMLNNSLADKAVLIRFDKRELPTFTQWKKTASFAEGYVTGLEPATDYPNSKIFERQCGRVVKLGPGEKRRSTLSIEVLTNAEAVVAAKTEISQLQHKVKRLVHEIPIQKYSDLDNI